MNQRVARVSLALGAIVLWALPGAARQDSRPAAPANEQRPAQDGAAPGAPGTPGAPGGRAAPSRVGMQVPMGATMKAMNRANKALLRQISDETLKEDNLRLISEMQRAAATAKAQALPDDVLANAKDEAERAAYALEHRRALGAALRLMLDIEDDIDAGKGAEAAKKLEALQALREKTHEFLDVEED